RLERQKVERIVRVDLRMRQLSVFFQAEDGIRDGHVTGVQTCALPISKAADSQTVRQEIRLWTAAVLRQRPEEPLQPVPLGQVHEIGRASCRERVWNSVVAV